MPISRENQGGRDRASKVATSGTADPAPRERGWTASASGRPNDLLRGVLAIAGLSSLAFAQPIYDLLKRSPEFFAIRDLYMGDLLALVAVLLVGPTLTFSAPGIVARFLRPSWTRWAIAPPVGLLAALIALQAASGLAAAVALAVPLLVWLGTSWAYVRLKGVRSLALLLAGAAIVVPALLILDGDVRRSAAPPKPTAEIDGPDTGARAPIVLVIFDEWSLTSILDAAGAIDRERLPNLARLADSATWYPNATAAADSSEIAVPAMLTGLKPRSGRLPSLADLPVNLFTRLAPSHEIHALEALTSLCPPGVNLLAEPQTSLRKRLGLLIPDLSMVWLHLTLPEQWTGRLPPVTQVWSGFGQRTAPSGTLATASATNRTGELQGSPRPDQLDQLKQRMMANLWGGDRAGEFRRFIASIRPAGERPGLYFIHSLLPHVPWEYLPSGRRYYTPRGGVHGLRHESWTPDASVIRHHEQRYLLQVGFVDRLIGELTERLESLGQFHQSLIIVTADHGLAFRPGRSRRHVEAGDPSGYQPLDLATVPLVIKAPFQRQGTVDYNPVSLKDLTPRILELAGADLAAELPPAPPESLVNNGRPVLFGKFVNGEVELPLDREPWQRERLAEQAALLGKSNDPVAIGEVPNLHGRRVSEVPLRSSEFGFRFQAAGLWDDVNVDESVLPLLVEGTFYTLNEPNDPETLAESPVAVALNGVVAASARPYQDADGKTRLAALLPEGLLRSGHNLIEIFLVGGGGDNIELGRLSVADREGGRGNAPQITRPPGDFDMIWGDSGRPEALIRRPAEASDGAAQRIEVIRHGSLGLTGFLDDSRGGTQISGWATNLRDLSDRLEIVAFLGGRQVWAGAAGIDRPDVARRHGYAHLPSGFIVAPRPTSGDRIRLRPGHLLRLIRREGLVVFAVSRGGRATRLKFSYRPLARDWWGRETVTATDGRVLPIKPVDSSFGGAIDVLARQGSRTVIEGWAADLERNERARQIVLYRDDAFLGALPAGRERSDVAAHYEQEGLRHTGFGGRVPGAPSPAAFSERHRVFALMLRGVAVELRVRPPEGPAVQQ